MTLDNNNKQPLVSICCTTYNHESYIRETIDGFLMQKTKFPIEIIIHDDASPDKTAEIIKEYADKYSDLVIPILQTENQLSKGISPSNVYVWPRVRGKYIALCEGDDYWTDPLKLQKQVDFLEANEHYGLVYTEIDRLHENTQIVEKNAFVNTLGIHPNTYTDFLVNPWFLAPCTWVFRRDLLAGLICQDNWKVGDYPLLLWIAHQSKIYFLNDNTAVYRILDKSASHHSSDISSYFFRKGIFNIQNYYLNIDTLDESLHSCIKENFYFPYFIKICLYDNNDVRKDSYTFIKEKEKLTLKIFLFYIFSSNPILKRILKTVYLSWLSLKLK